MFSHSLSLFSHVFSYLLMCPFLVFIKCGYGPVGKPYTFICQGSSGLIPSVSIILAFIDYYIGQCYMLTLFTSNTEIRQIFITGTFLGTYVNIWEPFNFIDKRHSYFLPSLRHFCLILPASHRGSCTRRIKLWYMVLLNGMYYCYCLLMGHCGSRVRKHLTLVWEMVLHSLFIVYQIIIIPEIFLLKCWFIFNFMFAYYFSMLLLFCKNYELRSFIEK